MAETTARTPLDERLEPAGAPSADPAYRAWKDAKVKKALEQAKDRSRMIPARKVWEKLGLER